MIHGPDSRPFREAVAQEIAERRGTKSALRYALCGRGDQCISATDGSVRVGPRGCGHRLCPRCSRKRGAKHAARVLKHLARTPHGWVYAITLTQRVRPHEAVQHSKRRFERKLRRWNRRMATRGMTASLVSIHITWSLEFGGWHYHAHVLAEFPDRMEDAEFVKQWLDVRGVEEISEKSQHVRLVVSAGPAIAGLESDGGDVDFWTESKDALAKAVQYPIRDVAQGVSLWRLGGEEGVGDRARELVREAVGWKQTRSWGTWRNPAPEPPAPDDEADQTEDAVERKAPKPCAEARAYGTMDRIRREARAGSGFAVELLALLEKGCRHDSEFSRRLLHFVRSAGVGVGNRCSGDP